MKSNVSSLLTIIMDLALKAIQDAALAIEAVIISIGARCLS